MNTFLSIFRTIRDAPALYRSIEPDLKSQYLQSDRFMIYLLFLHWLAAVFLSSITYQTYLLGILGGGVIFSVSFIGYHLLKGSREFRILAAFSLMSFSVLFIQQQLGRIEMHFHVFVALAFLTVYKDFLPLLFGAAYSITHHLVFNFLQEQSIRLMDTPIVIFNYGCGIDIALVHAFFVVVETVMLSYITIMRQHSFSTILNTNREIQYLNNHLEKAVEAKTAQIQKHLQDLKKTNTELLEAKNRALAANEARSNFIGSVSHELRTPLNAIINFTDMVIEDFEPMLKDPELQKESKDYLQRVMRNSRHLLELINDILEFTKAEAGKIQYSLRPEPLAPIIHNVMRNSEGFLEHNPIETRVLNCPEKTLVTTDARRLYQILLNLISNAIKFTKEGTITIRCHEEEAFVRVEVEDTGRGIPASKLKSIFDPFEQVTRNDAGTGLGLVIVKRLCDDMGINLTLESEEGKGTCFRLEIPKETT